MHRMLGTFVVLVGATFASAQTFSGNTADIPGPPLNAGFSENVELFDVDADGDSDAVWAYGGDFGNEQNRLWINLGGLQGGTTGVFDDQTVLRYPAVLDDSRDVDFVDLDRDGDLDLFVSNSSQHANQTNRFVVNMGGLQGGTPGYFTDQTSTRWLAVGVNNGTTHKSSVAPSVAIVTGGFVDWSCDTAMADLDGDGDPDLIEATYGQDSTGKVPTRVFLNDGAGFYEEFNPSGFQLSGTDIPNGSPGLWCEGNFQQQSTDATGVQCDIATEAISVDVGDFDGDFDLDFVLGEKTQLPRLFHNRTQEKGGVIGFRDVSWAVFPGPDWAPSSGSYEQDLGDLDNDGDLDIYGANWSNVCDAVLLNDGSGVFPVETLVANTCVRGNEPDFIDYDNDGSLDMSVVSRTADEAMFHNLGAAGSWTLEPTTTVLPPIVASVLGADANDADLDGDYDLFLATDAGDPDVYFRNDSQVPDTSAPRVEHLEQVADRPAGPAATVVRAHVYDNASWYVTSFDAVTLLYSVNGGGFTPVPMHFVGGQVFHGEIPGMLQGSIDYRVRASDAYGNAGVSVTKSFTAGPCTGAPTVYCTAKTHSNGCVPQIGASGTPSLSAGSGFVITSTQTLDNKSGLLFYSRTGPKFTPYQGGYLCVQPPTVRTPLQNSGSSGQAPCTGVFSFDFNAWLAGGGDPLLGLGDQVWAQYWSRDPIASFQTNRSDAVSFHICD